LILFVLCALLSIASDKFRTHQNLFPVMRAFSFIAIIAIGQCLVIISGGIDLSVGSVYGFSGLMTAFLIEKAGMAIPIGIIAGLAVGSALGMANGMLISCNDPSALNDVIAKAMADGIKMATFDAATIGSERMFYIGVDNYGVGKLGGKKYAELAAKKPGTVKTALLTRVLGAFNLEERIRGFKDGAQGTNVEIVSIQTCEDDINKAVQVIDDFTNANPELGGWFFIGGWPFFAPPDSLGTIKKLIDRGGLVVSIDNFYPMLDFVEAGMTQMLIGYSFYDMGY
jgi:hypothetical protein